MFRPLEKSADFPGMEKRVLEFWEKKRIFAKSLEGKTGGDFTFYDGPPFATGLPHYGHLLAGTIKDIVPRYWTMKGRRVERRFGWDCHGLPVESLIQNELGLEGLQAIRDYGVDRFNEACRASVLKYTREWEATVLRMGRWADFRNDYKTMDLAFMESVWWVFKTCYDRGLIYQGHRIQPYSPILATPLSNFEVNQGYRDTQDPSLTVTLPLVGSDEELLVWTTTPWTLPANLAVAVGPEIEYALVASQGRKFWIAESRRRAYFKDGEPVVRTAPGKALAGKRYRPLLEVDAVQNKSAMKSYPKRFTLLAADFVTTEDGTGAVHVAPSFGEDDFQLGEAEDLGLFDPLDEHGRFTDAVPQWQGRGAKEADKAIIRHLKERGRVFRHETMVHSYPFCYRTDVPLLYRALKTWFLKVDAPLTSESGETKTLKEWMLAANGQIRWVPGHIKEGRFGHWLEGARDWNLSRNRFWGTPIPVWVAEDGDRICVGGVEELARLTGQKDIADLHKHLVDELVIRTRDKKTFDASGKVYRRTPEVLDCWFESGAMPYAQNHYPFENAGRFDGIFPADFIAEGLDQTRGWFYTLTVLAAALFQKPAFKNVVINGIILAEDGRKMSKRLRNYPDPNALIERTSADAIRLFMIDSAAVKAGDLRFSEAGVVEMIRTVLLPLWNALGLFVTYANADVSKGQLAWRPGEERFSKNQLDRWILSDLQELLGDIEREMDAFRLYNVVPRVVAFIDDLTNWYIRRSRRRFWKSENDRDKNDAYATLYGVLCDFSKVLAPFLPFLAEEMYQVLVREVDQSQPESVHLCDFPVRDEALVDAALVRRMALVRQAVNIGRKIRAQKGLKNRQPLSHAHITVSSEQTKQDLDSLAQLIRDELNVHSIGISTDEANLVKYKAKPNFKVLGPKIGKRVKEFAKKIAELDHVILAKLVKGSSVTIDGLRLSGNDLQIIKEVPESVALSAGPGLTVGMDTHLTPRLIEEGLAREAVNRIQNLRKEAGLEVTDSIGLVISTSSEKLKSALEHHLDYIRSEVLAGSVEFTDAHMDSPSRVEYNGQMVFFHLERTG